MSQPMIVPPPPRVEPVDAEPDFSLVVGGPLYQLYLKARLAQPALGLLYRRIIDISLICWLPLLVLSAAEGHLTGGVRISFLRDPEVHVRFLFALPLLIASELLVHQRVRLLVAEFLKRGMIAESDRLRFQQIIDSAMRLRNSVWIEIIMLALVLTLGHWTWEKQMFLPVSSWYAIDHGNGLELTGAGKYYAFVSLGIFRFLLYRWYFRIFIWYRFLWQVRGLPLQLNLYHPDRAAGLGFLSASLLALSPVFVAQTAVLSSNIFTRILYTGATLPAFKMQIAGVLVFCMLVVTLPLLFFVVILERTQRRANIEFGELASQYVDDFRAKWVKHSTPRNEELLGTSDMQSLADLANSFAVVNEIRVVPVTKQALIRLLILLVLPLLPLTLTMVPLDKILEKLFQMVV
ncbi:MAG TPA: hypothetical protein VHN74_12125 [Candidatus Angelobacter sp.]|jgi:hypothetical protein|nr:hypothetical protein [Candidatus Angelobacter sp.]